MRPLVGRRKGGTQFQGALQSFFSFIKEAQHPRLGDRSETPREGTEVAGRSSTAPGAAVPPTPRPAPVLGPLTEETLSPTNPRRGHLWAARPGPSTRPQGKHSGTLLVAGGVQLAAPIRFRDSCHGPVGPSPLHAPRPVSSGGITLKTTRGASLAVIGALKGKRVARPGFRVRLGLAEEGQGRRFRPCAETLLSDAPPAAFLRRPCVGVGVPLSPLTPGPRSLGRSARGGGVSTEGSCGYSCLETLPEGVSRTIDQGADPSPTYRVPRPKQPEVFPRHSRLDGVQDPFARLNKETGQPVQDRFCRDVKTTLKTTLTLLGTTPGPSPSRVTPKTHKPRPPTIPVLHPISTQDSLTLGCRVWQPRSLKGLPLPATLPSPVRRTHMGYSLFISTLRRLSQTESRVRKTCRPRDPPGPNPNRVPPLPQILM